MKKWLFKNNSPIIVSQLDQRDCGVACLLSVIKHYKGTGSIENLRKLSGTNVTGTTLLGLYEAAMKTGFDAAGCQADIQALTVHDQPCILHVVIDDNVQHYVVCFGSINKTGELLFVIGDPARGINYMTPNDLEKIWKSKTCLTLQPNSHFKYAADLNTEKRKWILQLVKNDFPLLTIAAVLGVGIATLGLVLALFSQKLIDEILPNRAFTKLNLGIGLVLMLLLLREGLSYLRQYFLLRQSKDFNNRIINYFYTRLLNLPKPFFDTRKIGELTARLNDTSRIQRVITQIAGNVIIDFLVTIVTLTFLFFYSKAIALSCLLFFPLYFFLIYRNNKSIISGQRSMMSSYAISEANYISTLQGIDSIKNHNKQPLFIQSNKVLYNNFQEKIFTLGKIQLRLSLLANIFGVIFLIIVLALCSYQVLHQELQPGELVAILGMTSTLLPSIANLALVSIPANEAAIAFDRMFEFTGIEMEPVQEYAFNNFTYLQVQDLTFRFAGRSALLKNVSFEVGKGEIIAIIGENGNGKSTLSHIIQKNYQPESGSIRVNRDIDLSQISLNDWRRITAVVPQSIHIFNCSVLENIAFDDAFTKTEEVLRFLQLYGFAEMIQQLPQSYLTIVGEEGINLSGGQKQIIAIARALYHKPQLLILDEATAAMDRASEKFIFRLLGKIKNEMGIIFITHRLHVLRSLCDRIYILDRGLISDYGNHRELMKTENLYSAYWEDLKEN